MTPLQEWDGGWGFHGDHCVPLKLIFRFSQTPLNQQSARESGKSAQRNGRWPPRPSACHTVVAGARGHPLPLCCCRATGHSDTTVTGGGPVPRTSTPGGDHVTNGVQPARRTEATAASSAPTCCGLLGLQQVLGSHWPVQVPFVPSKGRRGVQTLSQGGRGQGLGWASPVPKPHLCTWWE